MPRHRHSFPSSSLFGRHTLLLNKFLSFLCPFRRASLSSNRDDKDTAFGVAMNGKKRPSFLYLPILNDSGQGLIEYSMLLMLVAMVVLAALLALGTTLDSGLYKEACSAIISASQ
jgi:Flp pilus assembly pilin Flp